MTIVARRGRVVAEPRRRPHGFDRVTAAVPRTEISRELGRIALDVVLHALDPVTLPARWSTRAFAREVAEIRAQLAPIHSRRSLVESFGREAAVAATVTPSSVDPGIPPGPVRVAYAIRWLELGDERLRPSWDLWIGRPVRTESAVPATSAAPLTHSNGEITT
jgi:hypothetical protein